VQSERVTPRSSTEILASSIGQYRPSIQAAPPGHGGGAAGLGGRSVAVTMALFLTIPLVVFLPPVPHFRAVLVHLQPTFQLLGAALFLRGRVPFFLLLVQRLKLAFEGVIAGPGRLVGVRHAGPPTVGGCKGPMQAG
jgi:hypothetical protein